MHRAMQLQPRFDWIRTIFHPDNLAIEYLYPFTTQSTICDLAEKLKVKRLRFHCILRGCVQAALIVDLSLSDTILSPSEKSMLSDWFLARNNLILTIPPKISSAAGVIAFGHVGDSPLLGSAIFLSARQKRELRWMKLAVMFVLAMVP